MKANRLGHHASITARTLETVLMDTTLGNSRLFSVQKSQIHGNGVFTTWHVPKNTIITFYDGEDIDRATALSRPDKSYMRTVSFGHHVIDGLRNPTRGRGAGSFVNHSSTPNAAFWIRHDRVWIKALRDIQRDEEILVSYGRFYWQRSHDEMKYGR